MVIFLLAFFGLIAFPVQAEDWFSGRPLAYRQTSGKVVAAYLSDESIAAGYRVGSETANDLTHLLFAFLRIGDDDRVAVGDRVDDAAITAYFGDIRQRAPRLKMLASIGGAAGSRPFFAMSRSVAGRATFVRSAVDFLAAHPMFDGIDIDWECPTDSFPETGQPQLGRPEDGRRYAELLHDLRGGLDRLGGVRHRRYLLTSAVSVAGRLTGAIDYRRARRPVDLFFAMTYDYYGPWKPKAGHHTPVLPPADTGLGPIGIQTLIAAGLPAAKLVIGAAGYSRGWSTDPAGKLDGDYNRKGGVELYRDLAPLIGGAAGWRVTYDAALHAYSLANPETGVSLGYDDPRAVGEKARRAVDGRFAGVFLWELAQDNGDLVNAMNAGVGNRFASRLHVDHPGNAEPVGQHSEVR